MEKWNIPFFKKKQLRLNDCIREKWEQLKSKEAHLHKLRFDFKYAGYCSPRQWDTFIDKSLLQNTMFFYDPKNPQPSNVLIVLIKHVFMQ